MLMVFAKGPGHLNSHVAHGVCEIEILFNEPIEEGYLESSVRDE